MKQFYKKLNLLVFLLLASTLTFAQDFVINGINYSVITGTTNVMVLAQTPEFVVGDITIPSTVSNANKTYSVKKIGFMAFANCINLTSITIPNSVTDIGIQTFYNCKALTSISIPNSVDSIRIGLFNSCISLTTVSIPNSIISIGSGAFYNCKSLTNIIVPNSVTIIEDGAFTACSKLTSFTIPNSISIIGSGLFDNCSSLTNISIPNSVTSIRNGSFKNCSSLSSITIPKSVTSIGNGAFKGCTSLTSITLEANSPITITSSVFERVANTKEIFTASIYTTATLYVPAGSKTAYQNDAIWGKFANIVEYSVTGTESLNSLEANVNIFPNPASENITISFNESISCIVSIIDSKGNVVLTKAIAGNSSNISTSELSIGVYVVKISTEKGVVVKQLVVR